MIKFIRRLIRVDVDHLIHKMVLITTQILWDAYKIVLNANKGEDAMNKSLQETVDKIVKQIDNRPNSHLIVVLRGIPASGKTSFAKELMAMYPEGRFKRTNKDELRAMIDDGRYSTVNEAFIRMIRDLIIHNILIKGESVIVDDTNLDIRHVNAVMDLMKKYAQDQITLTGKAPDIGMEVIDFPITLAEALRRNDTRPVAEVVPKKHITRMYHEHKTILKQIGRKMRQ